jgi:hypothetical protein
MRRAAAALLIAATIATGSVADAASRVAVVAPRDPDPTTREATTRLEAELRGAGFEVVSVPALPGGDPRAAVEATPVEPRPIATIAIQPTQGGAVADVWVADHLSDKTLVRKIRVDDADPSSAVSTLSIRAVELLRASLLELREPTQAPRPVPADVARWIAPTKAVSAPRPELAAGPRPTLALAGAVLGSYVGFGATFGPLIRVSLPAPLGTFARATLFAGASRPEVSGLYGSASLSQETATVGLARPFGPFKGLLRPSASLAAGAYYLRTAGTAVASRPTAGSASTWAFVVDAGGGLAAQLGAHVSLEAELHTIFLAPQPALSLAGLATARAGEPMFLGSLGFELSI